MDHSIDMNNSRECQKKFQNSFVNGLYQFHQFLLNFYRLGLVTNKLEYPRTVMVEAYIVWLVPNVDVMSAPTLYNVNNLASESSIISVPISMC